MSGFRLPRTVLLTVLAAVLVPTLATAGDNAPRQHDRGFFLRMSGGPGAGNIHSHTRGNDGPFDDGTKVSLEGSGGDGNFAIGAIVRPNLAVHATFWGWSAFDPDLKVGGATAETNDLTVSMNAFGPGVTWYFGQNFYLSGSIGGAEMTAEADGEDFDSKTGVAVDLTIGKEWWVGRRWGLGVAAGFGALSIPTDDPTLDDKFSGNSFGLRFSATFN